MSAALDAREPSARYLEAVQPALVRQFELLATAPGGVARLRELLLALAVRGTLVPQESSEGHANSLVAQLHARNSESAGGARVNSLNTATRNNGEFPCQLPAGWVWVRLTDLGQFCGGKTPSKQHAAYWSGSIPWITPKDMKQLRLTDSEDHVSQAAVEDGLALVPPHSLLVVVRSGILRRTVPTAVNLVETTINQDLKALKLSMPEMAPYVQLLVRGFERFILETLTKSGTTVESIRFDDFASQPFPLPPLAEQARIVARVDELMRLCDALEAKGRLEAEQHARLLGALLGTLTDSTTPEELATNWQRVAEHFDLLLDRPEAVDALEQTVLTLALRGLLVAHKGTGAKAGRQRPLSGLPPGWERTNVGSTVSMLNGYAFKSEWFKTSGVRLVRNINVGHGRIDWTQPAHVTPAVADSLSQFELHEGDIVLSLDRPIISTGLKLAVVRACDVPCLLLQRVARLTPVPTVLPKSFLVMWLQSDLFVSAIDPGRSNGVPHISTKQVAALSIDIPPLTEQARIVARVSELRRLCADLRQRLAASAATQSHLADALVEQALA